MAPWYMETIAKPCVSACWFEHHPNDFSPLTSTTWTAFFVEGRESKNQAGWAVTAVVANSKTGLFFLEAMPCVGSFKGPPQEPPPPFSAFCAASPPKRRRGVGGVISPRAALGALRSTAPFGRRMSHRGSVARRRLSGLARAPRGSPGRAGGGQGRGSGKGGQGGWGGAGARRI